MARSKGSHGIAHGRLDRHEGGNQWRGIAKAGLTADARDDIAEDPTTGIGYAHVVSVLTEVKKGRQRI